MTTHNNPSLRGPLPCYLEILQELIRLAPHQNKAMLIRLAMAPPTPVCDLVTKQRVGAESLKFCIRSFQRDLFNLFLIHAALQSPQKHHHRYARYRAPLRCLNMKYPVKEQMQHIFEYKVSARGIREQSLDNFQCVYDGLVNCLALPSLWLLQLVCA